MRIACLQFAPTVGDVEDNIKRADAILEKAELEDVELLVLPEMAFSGYNFKSLEQVRPFVEPTTSGKSSDWARQAARKYNCFVTVGYPEIAKESSVDSALGKHYNSAVTINADGTIIANYRKSFLYYTDETWASEGSGFFGGNVTGIGNVVMGICMDLNPYKFEAPWTTCEFAQHIIHEQADLVILSMAWLTHENASSFRKVFEEPDMATLSYWLVRLDPVRKARGLNEVIIVFANRTGVENEAVYAGTSAVVGIKEGEMILYGLLGRGEEKVLIVDTSSPRGKLAFNLTPAHEGSPS